MDNIYQNIPFIERVLLWQVLMWASGYLVGRSKGITPGLPRLLVALPLVFLNVSLPLLFFSGQNDTMTAVIAFMGTTGLANFKILAWVMGRGPLATPWLTPSQTAAVYALIIAPTESSNKRKTWITWIYYGLNRYLIVFIYFFAPAHRSVVAKNAENADIEQNPGVGLCCSSICLFCTSFQ